MNTHNYGFIFNDLIIDSNYVIKKGKNEKGNNKINNEILFYDYIKNNNIEFNIPSIITTSNGYIKMEYLKNTIILTEIININNYKQYIELFFCNINNLHCHTKQMNKIQIKKDVLYEIETKLISRYDESELLIQDINYVNFVPINGDIKYYIKKIKQQILPLIKNIDSYSLIHGDTHLNNILTNDDQMYFIDPRGIFGKTLLFGLKEYDYAKFLFGLLGYSKFDNMNINNLDIRNNNLNIDFIKNYEFIFETTLFDELTKLLTLSIWLANNSTFQCKKKRTMSLMIAFYYCEKYFTLE